MRISDWSSDVCSSDLSFEEQQSPLAALIDPGALERQFKINEAGDHDGMSWLVLLPNNGADAQVTQAWLGFRDGKLRRMELHDALDQRTVIALSKWRRKPDQIGRAWRGERACQYVWIAGSCGY